MELIARFVLLIALTQVVNCDLFAVRINNTSSYTPKPEWYMPPLDVIAKYGYPAESYVIPSSDGFLLTLQRIPGSGQPVYLQHGLLSSSFSWLSRGANESLAFVLADAGYDVWLGNARGNVYSRGHAKYPPSDTAFWDFTWHEMGVLDLPAVFKFIERKTKTKGEIIYVGHSMGTTMFFVYASTVPDASETVKMMVALAPVAYMSDVRSPVKYLAPWSKDIMWLATYLGLNEFLPKSKIIELLADLGCEKDQREVNLCEDVFFLICGFDKEEFDQENLPMIINHHPDGTSTKNVIHYLQEIGSPTGNFKQYDYGPEENMKRYGSKEPPAYNVSNIQIPIYLMSGLNDRLASPKDVHKLATKLPKIIQNYVVPMKDFNHIDFLFGKHVNSYVNEPLLKVIKNFTVT